MPDTEPFSIESLKPADTPEYMMPAWLGCISWAAKEPDILAAFREETGNHWTPAQDPIGRMVDEATGIDKATIKQFVLWVNQNVWGPL